ncbi:MAG TPA: DUF2059 domain-containing protein [Beijerinckiaceae bacterium]|nr:DUF2059 domain-containing protein [Beijerinckiaceae bacterium]
MAHRLFHRAFAGIGLIGMLAALASAPALAQQAAPAQTQQPAAPATPPPPPVPPAQLALARQVMVASGVTESFEPIAGNIALQLLRAYTQKRPANAKDFEDILLGMKPELDAKKNDLINKAAEAYARQIDEGSLKAILAFFQSPAGMKYKSALPQVLNEVSAVTDSWTKEVATQMGEHVVEEMKKRGVDLGR